MCKNKLPEAEEEATATAAECTLGNCSGAVARGDRSCRDEGGEVDAGPKFQVRERKMTADLGDVQMKLISTG